MTYKEAMEHLIDERTCHECGEQGDCMTCEHVHWRNHYEVTMAYDIAINILKELSESENELSGEE